MVLVIDKEKCKFYAKKEETWRAGYLSSYNLWKRFLPILRASDMGRTHTIVDPNGTERTLYSICEENGKTSLEDVEAYMAELKRRMKRSREHQRWWIYVHNGDVAHARVSHGKLTAYADADMLQYSEHPEDADCGLWSIESGRDVEDLASNEGGYLAFCDLMKNHYEQRVEILEVMSSRN